MARDEQLQTDTHLSKNFNSELIRLVSGCNLCKQIVESTPHYDSLKQYYASLNTLFVNTFFLFHKIPQGKTTLAKFLIDAMCDIQKGMDDMKYYADKRNMQAFDTVLKLCNRLHMYIMLGLHQRQMLVRMSEREPRGAESIAYWDEKTIFKRREKQALTYGDEGVI